MHLAQGYDNTGNPSTMDKVCFWWFSLLLWISVTSRGDADCAHDMPWTVLSDTFDCDRHIATACPHILKLFGHKYTWTCHQMLLKMSCYVLWLFKLPVHRHLTEGIF